MGITKNHLNLNPKWMICLVMIPQLCQLSLPQVENAMTTAAAVAAVQRKVKVWMTALDHQTLSDRQRKGTSGTVVDLLQDFIERGQKSKEEELDRREIMHGEKLDAINRLVGIIKDQNNK